MAKIKQMPRCGAKAKSTGEPCRRQAMANGRCRLHGGRVPSGENWHKTRLPKKGEYRGLEKFEAKLAAKEKRGRRRAQSLAAMTPEERQRHDQWQQAHTPGPIGKRAQRRQQLATKAMLDKLLVAGEERAGECDWGVFG